MPTSGLRERKKQETRQALRSAALHLTAERGLENVTVEGIAAAADVSTRTFFNYFPSKEQALIGSDPELMAHVAALLADRPVDEAPLYSLEALLEEFAARLVDARDEYVLRRKVIADNPALSSGHVAAFVDFERVLAETIRKRQRPGADADVALVVAAAVAAMRVSVDQWVDDEAETDLLALLHGAITRLAQGFGPASEGPGTPTRGPGRKTLRKDHR
ncbi:MAG TPA: TetR family transcriptional regulator [Mycobacteriales bacterium]|nr:TetR family transcriptional regulator [Mycobacteriales bacterium]